MMVKSSLVRHRIPMLFLFGTALFLCLYSCSKRPEVDADSLAAMNERFSAMMASGEYDRADSMINAERSIACETDDSDRWCATKVQEAVLNYYLCRPDGMLSAIDSAVSYLDRMPETVVRLRMHQKALQAKGTVYTQFYFNPDSATYYLTAGADMAERAGDRKAYALALANAADAFKTNSQLDKASDYYHRAILEADTAGFLPQDYISLYGGLATVYTGLRDFENSAIWWKKTMALWPSMIPYEKFNNLNNYGNDFYYRGDYAGALNVFRRLDHYLDSLPSATWEKNFVSVNLADCYLRLGMADSVKDILPAASRYFTEEQANPVAMSYIHTLQMRKAWLNGDNNEVDRLIGQHPFSDTLRPEMQLLRLEFLTDYYDDIDNKSKAFGTLRQYEQIDDSLRSVTVSQSIAARRFEYERDADLLRLKAANAEQGSRIMRLLAVIAVIIVVLLTVIGIVLISRRNIRRREERMLEKIASLRSESIRSRITPHFIYNALNHEIRNRDAGMPSRLESIVSLLRQQQFVASELLTSLEKEIEFTDAYIAVQSDNLQGRLDYKLSIEDGLDPAALRMPSMLLQILVENAFKHAFPSIQPPEPCLLSIRVYKEGDEVHIEVFNSTSPDSPTSGLPPKGTGLRIIMETIRILKEKHQVDIHFTLNLNHKTATDGVSGCLASYTIPYQWMKNI